MVEADPAATRAEARRFTARRRFVLPGTRPLCAWYFRRVIAGQGVGAEDLARLLTAAGFGDVRTQKAPGKPLVIATGGKPLPEPRH